MEKYYNQFPSSKQGQYDIVIKVYHDENYFDDSADMSNDAPDSNEENLSENDEHKTYFLIFQYGNLNPKYNSVQVDILDTNTLEVVESADLPVDTVQNYRKLLANMLSVIQSHFSDHKFEILHPKPMVNKYQHNDDIW